MNVTTQPPTNTGRRWLLANTIGLAVGMPLFGAIADSGIVDHESLAGKAAHLVGLAAAGAVLGTLQAWAVGQPRSRWRWIAVDAVGLTVAFVLGYALFGPPVDFLLAFATIGTAAVYLLERARRAVSPRTLLTGAGLGLLAAVVGVVPMMILGDAIDTALGGGLLAFAVILALMGAVAGLVFGATTRRTAISTI